MQPNYSTHLQCPAPQSLGLPAVWPQSPSGPRSPWACLLFGPRVPAAALAWETRYSSQALLQGESCCFFHSSSPWNNREIRDFFLNSNGHRKAVSKTGLRRCTDAPHSSSLSETMHGGCGAGQPWRLTKRLQAAVLPACGSARGWAPGLVLS